jgi:urea transport system permease protein
MTEPVMSAAPAVEAAAAPVSPLDRPPPPPSRSWIGRIFIALFLVALFAPVVLYADDRYWLPMITRYMCMALFALSVDLIWGYTGLLSLGQGLYFGLGVYAIGYSLKLQRAAILAATQAHTAPDFTPGPDMAMPDFMGYCGLTHVPFWIAPFINIWLAIALAVLVPTLIAAVFGGIAFVRRIKGVYFSLITQAVLLAVFTLVDNQQPYTGGRVGMTYLAKLELFGKTFEMRSMFLLVTGTLVAIFLLCYWLTGSKFGKLLTAIRDNEYRVMALGYNTAMYKTFVFALAGAIAGIAGALYAATMGTAGPDRFGVVASIEIVIMVAVGGRGTLVGAVLGALLVSTGESLFSDFKIGDSDIQTWPIIMGALFIGVVLFMPNGIMGALRNLTARLQQRFFAARAA